MKNLGRLNPAFRCRLADAFHIAPASRRQWTLTVNRL
jgi:hypothetical protein